MAVYRGDGAEQPFNKAEWILLLGSGAFPTFSTTLCYSSCDDKKEKRKREEMMEALLQTFHTKREKRRWQKIHLHLNSYIICWTVTCISYHFWLQWWFWAVNTPYYLPWLPYEFKRPPISNPQGSEWRQSTFCSSFNSFGKVVHKL